MGARVSSGLRWDSIPPHLRDRVHEQQAPSTVPLTLTSPKPTPKKKPLNKTELRYQNVLDRRMEAGEIARYLPHESIKLRLATLAWWSPDFPVITLAGGLEFHEVKGRSGSGFGGWQDDARVKLRVTSEAYPCFGFRVFVWNKGTGCFIETERFNCS